MLQDVVSPLFESVHCLSKEYSEEKKKFQENVDESDRTGRLLCLREKKEDFLRVTSTLALIMGRYGRLMTDMAVQLQKLEDDELRDETDGLRDRLLQDHNISEALMMPTFPYRQLVMHSTARGGAVEGRRFVREFQMPEIYPRLPLNASSLLEADGLLSWESSILDELSFVNEEVSSAGIKPSMLP
jgi:hypothetical protein